MEEKNKMDSKNNNIKNEKIIQPLEIEEGNQNQIIDKKNKSKEIIDENAININAKKDLRIITEEVIDIINKDKYKKYKIENKNEITKIKIEGEEKKEKEKEKQRKSQELSEMLEIELLKAERNYLDKLIEYKLLFEFIDLLKVKTIRFRDITISYLDTLLKEQAYIVKEKNNLNLEEIIFKNSDIYKFNINQFFPKITKLKIIQCNIPFELNDYIHVNNLTHLMLDNIGLITENFDSLIAHICKNNSKNIRVISVKNNNIGVISFDNSVKLENLEILDASNNKISLFNCNPNFLNSKLIDLTSNRITFTHTIKSLLEQFKKIFFLLTNNYGLLRENVRKKYINYLFEKLPLLDYPIKKLPLINLYVGKDCIEKMKQLDLTKFQNSLQELDISFGCLNNNDIISLLNKNLVLSNLKKLNLKRNKITEKIFELLIESNYHTKFVNLKELDFSENDININVHNDNMLTKFLNFLEKFISIKKFIVKNTPFELKINDYIHNKIILLKQNKNKTHLKNDEMKKEIIYLTKIDNYLKEKTNAKIYIYNINNSKYVSQIEKKKLFEKIKIKDKFKNPN